MFGFLEDIFHVSYTSAVGKVCLSLEICVCLFGFVSGVFVLQIPPTQDEVTPQRMPSMITTYQTRASSAAEHQYFTLRSRRAAADLVDPPLRPAVPLRRCRVNMTLIVDIEGILPEGCVHFLTGEPLLYMDVVPICEFHSEAQLHNTTVDDIKWEIQDLCWQCLRVSIRKRDFKLWLRVLPPNSIPWDSSP